MSKIKNNLNNSSTFIGSIWILKQLKQALGMMPNSLNIFLCLTQPKFVKFLLIIWVILVVKSWLLFWIILFESLKKLANSIFLIPCSSVKLFLIFFNLLFATTIELIFLSFGKKWSKI